MTLAEFPSRPEAIRAVLTLPNGGIVVMAAFPGLATAPDGTAFIDPEEQTRTAVALAALGAEELLVLLEEEELPEGAVAMLGFAAQAAGLSLTHTPIRDFSTPDARFMARWNADRKSRDARLSSGGTVALCCQYGAGRSGMMAALLFIEAGVCAEDAIKAVRAGFAEAVESPAQEAWLLSRGMQDAGPKAPTNL